MPAKRRINRKSANKNKTLFIFIAIVIVLAIISMLVAYFLVDKNNEDDKVVMPTEQKETQELKVNLDAVKQIAGTWVSNYDGAMLTISDLSFSIETSGVDATAKITGTLAVEGNIVTFVYTSGNKVCEGIEGHYLYSLEENGELFFKLIKDSCSSREERMSATWFKL